MGKFCNIGLRSLQVSQTCVMYFLMTDEQEHRLLSGINTKEKKGIRNVTQWGSILASLVHWQITIMLTFVWSLFLMMDTALLVNKFVEYFPLALRTVSSLSQKSNPGLASSWKRTRNKSSGRKIKYNRVGLVRPHNELYLSSFFKSCAHMSTENHSRKILCCHR